VRFHVSDRSDEILKSLGKLKPNEMREIIENLASQSPHAEKWPTPELDKLAQLAHLPNRLSAEDIIERASLRAETKYYHITDGLFETVVSSQDAKDLSEAYKVAYEDRLHPWYFTRGLKPTNSPIERPHKILNHDEYVDWLRRE
jgi:hypothetical protein